MRCEPISLIDVCELRGEAAEARCLAVKFKDRETVSDLLNYAAALEGDADFCEQALGQRSKLLRPNYFANHFAGARH